MQISKSEFKKGLLAAVEGYVADEETYDDNAQLQIDPQTGKVTVVDSEDMAPEGVDPIADDDKVDFHEGMPVSADIAGMDYYDVMDLVKMDPENPGSWKPDVEAVDSVVDEYFK